MPLAKQKVLVPFGGGVDTKSAKHVVQPGALLRADDVKFAESGSVMKRERYSDVSLAMLGGGSVASIRAVARYKTARLLAWDANRLYESSTGGMADKGFCLLAGISESAVRAEPSTSRTNPCAASVGGYTVTVYDKAKYSVTDEATGAEIVTDGIASDVFNIKKISATKAILVSYDGAKFGGYYFDSASPTSLTAITATFTVGADTYGSLWADEALGRCYVVYRDTSAGDVGIFYYTSDNTKSATRVVTFSVVIYSICVVGTDGVVHVVWEDNRGGKSIRAIGYPKDITALVSPAYAEVTVSGRPINTVEITGVGVGATAAIFMSVVDLTNVERLKVYRWSINETGAVANAPLGGSEITLATVSLAGDAQVTARGDIVVPLLYWGYEMNEAGWPGNKTLQACYLFCDGGLNIFGRAAYGRGPVPNYSTTTIFIAAQRALMGRGYVNGDTVVVPLITKGEPLPGDGTYSTSDKVSLVSVGLRNNGCHRAEIGQSLLFSQGGTLWGYDGVNVAEHQFLLFPEAPYAAPDIGGAGALTGTYRYRLMYSWTDANGQMHRSAPSPATSVTLAAQDCDLKIPPLAATHKPGVVIEIYRTTASGSIFYYVSRVNNVLTGVDIAYNDTLTDASLTSNATIYTTGGEVDDGPPDYCGSMEVRGRRVFAYVGGGQLAYTKGVEDGFVPAFSDFFRHPLNDRGGIDGMAMAEMDGSLVAITNTDVQVLTGDGPGPTGAGGGFSEFRHVATDDGVDVVTDGAGKESVVHVLRTDTGIVYQGKRGVMLLNRALQVQYIGAPVERYLRSYNATEGVEIVGFVLNAKEHQVICATTAGFLVYDYSNGQWARWTLGNANLGVIDAEMVGDRLHAILWNSNTNAFDSLIKLPDLEDRAGTPLGADESMVVETAWIKLDGLAGFQRLYYATVLAEWRSSHTMRVRVYYDYDETAAATITNAATSGYAIGDRLQFRFHLGRKCQAVKMQITDLNPSGNKDSFRLFGVELEIGVKGGHFRPVTTR